MKCVAAILILAVLAVNASALSSSKLVAQAVEKLRAHPLLAKIGASSCATPATPKMSLDTLLQASSAKAACKATKFSAYDVAQAALNVTAVPVFTPSVCVTGHGDSGLDTIFNCNASISYPDAARNDFNNSVKTNAQPGHAIGVISFAHFVITISASGSGQSITIKIDMMEKDTGLIAAMPNACDDADVAAMMQVFATVVAQLNGAMNQYIQCLASESSTQGVSVWGSAVLDMSETIYTQLDSSYQPVESSKQQGQGEAGKNAAAGLAAPAHVWLLTAAAAVALLFAKLH